MPIFFTPDSDNAIYNMDYMELLQMLPDKCIQLILTDPPYGINYQNGYTQNKMPHLSGDTGIDYMAFANQCYRVLQDNSHAYFFTRFDQYPLHYGCLIEAGFSIKNCLVIEKGTIGGIGDLYGSYANNSEWVIFCQKGRRVFNKTKLMKNVRHIGRYNGEAKITYKTRFNSCWFGSDYPKANKNSAWRLKHGFEHPTMKNVECLEWLIQISSNPYDMVLDPFMGSGSTALAAVGTGRRYLGSEIEVAYYRLSQQRLADMAK
jgi:DNA modification methylase